MVNRSNRSLNTTELDVLSLRLSLCIPKLKTDFMNHYFSFENSAKQTLTLPLPKKKIVTEISSTAHNSLEEFDEGKRSFTKLLKSICD